MNVSVQAADNDGGVDGISAELIPENPDAANRTSRGASLRNSRQRLTVAGGRGVQSFRVMPGRDRRMHTRRMTRKWGVSLLASILVSGLVTAVVLVAANQTDRRGSVGQAAAATADPQGEAENDDGGGGPPPWAHASSQGKGRGADKTWKEAWKKLTPAQKQKNMTALVKAHEQGMTKWAGCVAAAGNDASERATCLKPLPPGLAKKLP